MLAKRARESDEVARRGAKSGNGLRQSLDEGRRNFKIFLAAYLDNKKPVFKQNGYNWTRPISFHFEKTSLLRNNTPETLMDQTFYWYARIS